jgi:hypothetical protein
MENEARSPKFACIIPIIFHFQFSVGEAGGVTGAYKTGKPAPVEGVAEDAKRLERGVGYAVAATSPLMILN